MPIQIQPFDFAGAAQGGMGPIESYAEMAYKKRMAEAQEGQIAVQRAQIQQKQQAAQLEQQQEAAYQAAVEQALLNPTPQNIAALHARFPDKSEAIKRGWDVMDKDRQESDFRSAAEILGALESNNLDLAKNKLRQRIDADGVVDEKDERDQALLADLESGDPIRIKAARGTIKYVMSAAMPERFSDINNSLKRETTVLDNRVLVDRETGEGITQVPSRLSNGPGGIYEEGPIAGVPIVGGGTPAVVAAPTPPVAAPAVTPAGGSPPATPGRGFEQNPNVNLTQAKNFGSRFGTVTNTKRGPGDYERLKKAGYNPAKNSLHNTGQGLDIARKRGVTHAQIVAEYKTAGYVLLPGTKDEGNHSHIEIAATPGRGGKPADGIPRVKSAQQWAKLPAGAQYYAPDGSLMRKK